MAKRSKKPADVNRLAAAIISDATDAEGPEDEEEPSQQVVAGRLGGLKGGKARASKLSAKRRSEIAKKAAQARWSKV